MHHKISRTSSYQQYVHNYIVVLVWKLTEIVIRDHKSHILVRGSILRDVIFDVHKLLLDKINLNLNNQTNIFPNCTVKQFSLWKNYMFSLTYGTSPAVYYYYYYY